MAKKSPILCMQNEVGRRYFIHRKTLKCYIEVELDRFTQDFINEAVNKNAIRHMTNGEIRFTVIDADFVEKAWSKTDKTTKNMVAKMRNELIDGLNEEISQEYYDKAKRLKGD